MMPEIRRLLTSLRRDASGEDGRMAPSEMYRLADLVEALITVDAPANRSLRALEEIEAAPHYQQPNWDSYGGAPIDPRAIAAVRKFLGYAWSVVPSSDGGIQLEAHHSGIDLEVSFGADGEPECVYAQVVALFGKVK